MTARKFSLYDIEQFIREAGAERITEDAVLGLEKEIEDLAEKIANGAIRYAGHAGRSKLIRMEDVLLTDKHSHYPGPDAADHRSPANFRRNARTTNPASSIER
jgi:histone H3/H4